MASGAELTPSSYIAHHLSNLTKPFGGNGEGFWTVNVDTVVTSMLLGLLAFGFLYMVSRKVVTGVPGKGQAFFEMLYDFVDTQVKDIFHGDRRFINALCLTIFVWVLLMNAMDFLPIDIFDKVIVQTFGGHAWKPVPTSDLNTTLALALSVIGLTIIFSFKAKGFGGYMHELFCSPFGANPILWPFNFLFQMIELISKPLSLALRLYGNMYAGEIIFLLIGMLSAAGFTGVFFGGILHAAWAIFHILVVPLQAFIFMMLTAVYMAMAHESH
jgi:F-type H+-transporting ATPase subunit a